MHHLHTFSILAGCILILTGTCLAASWHPLSFSNEMGTEVFVSWNQDGWCKESVQIKVNLKADSPLLTNGLEAFLQKTAKNAAEKCSILKKAHFLIINNALDIQIDQYASSADTDWKAVRILQSPTTRLHQR